MPPTPPGYVPYKTPTIRPYKASVIAKTRSFFLNTSILCGTAIVLAVTVKVILSLF
jgi:hypothetical protein